MKVFDGRQFVTLYGALEKIHAWLDPPEPERFLVEESLKTMSVVLGELEAACSELALPISAKQAKAVNLQIQKPGVLAPQIGDFFNRLSEFITAEMDAHVFMYIEPTKAHLYSQPDLFGPEVAERFPSIAEDIEEAGK